MSPDCLSGAFQATFQSRVNQLAFGLFAIPVKYSCCDPQRRADETKRRLFWYETGPPIPRLAWDVRETAGTFDDLSMGRLDAGEGAAIIYQGTDP